MQIDLGTTKKVRGVITQGRSSATGASNWVLKYTLKTSLDGSSWGPESKVFNGNSNADSKITNLLSTAVEARYVRIYAKSWKDTQIAMRAAVVVEECLGNIFK